MPTELIEAEHRMYRGSPDKIETFTLNDGAQILDKVNKDVYVGLNNEKILVGGNTITNKVTDLENSIGSGNENFTILWDLFMIAEPRIGVNEADIDNVELRMTTAETDIDNVELRMTTAETDIDNVELRMTTAETDIDNIDIVVEEVSNSNKIARWELSPLFSDYYYANGRKIFDIIDVQNRLNKLSTYKYTTSESYIIPKALIIIDQIPLYCTIMLKDYALGLPNDKLIIPSLIEGNLIGVKVRKYIENNYTGGDYYYITFYTNESELYVINGNNKNPVFKRFITDRYGLTETITDGIIVETDSNTKASYLYLSNDGTHSYISEIIYNKTTDVYTNNGIVKTFNNEILTSFDIQETDPDLFIILGGKNIMRWCTYSGSSTFAMDTNITSSVSTMINNLTGYSYFIIHKLLLKLDNSVESYSLVEYKETEISTESYYGILESATGPSNFYTMESFGILNDIKDFTTFNYYETKLASMYKTGVLFLTDSNEIYYIDDFVNRKLIKTDIPVKTTEGYDFNILKFGSNVTFSDYKYVASFICTTKDTNSTQLYQMRFSENLYDRFSENNFNKSYIYDNTYQKREELFNNNITLPSLYRTEFTNIRIPTNVPGSFQQYNILNIVDFVSGTVSRVQSIDSVNKKIYSLSFKGTILSNLIPTVSIIGDYTFFSINIDVESLDFNVNDLIGQIVDIKYFDSSPDNPYRFRRIYDIAIGSGFIQIRLYNYEHGMNNSHTAMPDGEAIDIIGAYGYWKLHPTTRTDSLEFATKNGIIHSFSRSSIDEINGCLTFSSIPNINVGETFICRQNVIKFMVTTPDSNDRITCELNTDKLNLLSTYDLFIGSTLGSVQTSHMNPASTGFNMGASTPYNEIHGNTLYGTMGDYAEKYTCENMDNIKEGTVLIKSNEVEYNVKESDVDCASNFIGIKSSKPGFITNSKLENGLSVGIIGLLDVRVIGSVNKGDILVTTYNGCARVINDPIERIDKIGYADETNVDPNEKLVLCIIK